MYPVFVYCIRSYLKIFLPNLSLACEYQGETHYFSNHIFGRATDRQRADMMKQTFATRAGITLVVIPFWWNKSLSSIASTIQALRPDIELTYITDTTIPSHMPDKYYKRIKYLKWVSPKPYDEQLDPTGW
jgi:hypothetical protein